MTAYGAIISLKNTIEYILHSSHISLVDPSLHIMQLAYKELQPLQEILERLDNTSKSSSRKKVNALDGRIKEALWKFEDLLESIDHSDLQSPLDRLRDDVDSFIHTLQHMEREYLYELQNMLEDDGEPISSIIGFGGRKSKMIELSDQFEQVKSDLMHEYNWKHVYALVGMAGVGKTTLAKEIFQDPQISSHFEYRAWVTVGRKPQLTQVSQGILAQLCGITQGDDIIGDYLKGKKCLIVVDDVWETHVLNSLISSLLDIENGVILFLVTARERNVIANIVCSGFYDVVRFLNGEESKDLLCKEVFGEEICPPQLDKAATKIAKNCEGLPLLIVTVAHHLSKSHNRDPKYWNDVAEKRNSVFTDAYDEISKGPKWEAQEGSFSRLEFLLIEDTDLVQWKPRYGSFPKLSYLSIKHCYKLEEMHCPSDSIDRKIELVDCNPSALTWAKHLQPSPSTLLEVTASSSFKEKPMTITFRRFG